MIIIYFFINLTVVPFRVHFQNCRIINACIFISISTKNADKNVQVHKYVAIYDHEQNFENTFLHLITFVNIENSPITHLK